MIHRFLLVMALFGAASVQAAPPGSGDPDWRGLRRDVDAGTQRPGGNGEFEARRQVIRERARARYNEADGNGDGQLSREEMARLRPGMAKHFDRIDANGDGLASEQEIIDTLRQRHQMRREGLNRR
ncbi:MAG: hypothetical protein IV085_13000 [Thiobacillus sp.]|nr:hypothetical protein [Thiobacillus sp.]